MKTALLSNTTIHGVEVLAFDDGTIHISIPDGFVEVNHQLAHEIASAINDATDYIPLPD